MVWEGKDAVKTGRVLLGATNPLASAPGTIRGDYAIVCSPSSHNTYVRQILIGLKDVGRNVCHGSDAVDSAKKEIALWFKDEEKVSWKQAAYNWVYEK